MDTNAMSDAQLYEILGVRGGALSGTALQKAYKTASVRAHPDQGGDPALFTLIGNAFATLQKRMHEQQWGTSSSAYGAGVSKQHGKLAWTGR
jgi:DnaJ-class molecular chaperone